jgi:hypothetical protein
LPTLAILRIDLKALSTFQIVSLTEFKETIEISLNQGIAAYYRGTNALIYKLVLNHAMKFTLYETVFGHLS